MRLFRTAVAIFGVLAARVVTAGAEIQPWLVPSAPLPRILALAAARKIALAGFDPFLGRTSLRAGDAITVLFTLSDGFRRQQWLAKIEVVPLTTAERQQAAQADTIYSASGKQFRLTGAPAAFALRMFGPVRESEISTDLLDSIGEKRARFILREDYLSFGFDRWAELILRLQRIGQEIRLGMATGPFSPEQVAKGQRWIAEVGFSTEDELVCARQAFAQVEFLKLAQNTPGFREILAETLELPSFWSVLRTTNRGTWFNYDWKNVRQLEGTNFGLNSTTLASLPFGLTMLGKHVANGQWVATSARPPFLTSAGIVGLVIESPSQKSRRLELRVISARSAPE